VNIRDHVDGLLRIFTSPFNNDFVPSIDSEDVPSMLEISDLVDAAEKAKTDVIDAEKRCADAYSELAWALHYWLYMNDALGELWEEQYFTIGSTLVCFKQYNKSEPAVSLEKNYPSLLSLKKPLP
jgi:hypothetical protein